MAAARRMRLLQDQAAFHAGDGDADEPDRVVRHRQFQQCAAMAEHFVESASRTLSIDR